MGHALLAEVIEAEDLELAGAVDLPDASAIGQDAGTLCGCGPTGINVVPALTDEMLSNADAIIDFTAPGVTIKNVEAATKHDCGIVIGTTGHDDSVKEQLSELAEQGARIVLAPNMSVGVNLLFHLCAELAPILKEDYDIEVVEMHHNKKKDAPSGTAKRIGEILADATNRDNSCITHGRSGMTGERDREEIGIMTLRGGDVVGDHTVMFATEGERIELTHKASSRRTFSKGAAKAVRYLKTASAGVYDMQDVLGLR
jgi:4-hydroxy-tetrahydrodipicolinate reductase